MKPVRTAATLLAGLALTAAPILTACSQSTGGSSSSSSAASDSSAESDKGDDKDSDTKDSKKDAEADKTDKGDDKASASASASATKSDLPKATPAGYQEITAPTVGITFAVPEGWQAPLDATSDVYYKAPDDGFTPYLGNANVSKTTIPATKPLTEAELSPALTSIPGATSTGYSTEQTANGEAAVLNYTANIGGPTINGALIATPTKEKGKYAIISVNAGSSGQSIDELKTTILETIH